MKLDDFINSIEKHENFACEGILMEGRPEGDFLVIGNTAGLKFKVLVTAIQEQTWATLESVLNGGRDAVIMDHITRIVGYYSKVRNWNKSKLGELRDRKAGDYSFDAGEPDVIKQPIPMHQAEKEKQAVSAAV